jgi:hypothetical protein
MIMVSGKTIMASPLPKSSGFSAIAPTAAPPITFSAHAVAKPEPTIITATAIATPESTANISPPFLWILMS